MKITSLDISPALLGDVPFLRAAALTELDSPSDAAFAVFSATQDMMQAGRIGWINEVLASSAAAEASLLIKLALLSAVLPVRDQLPVYAAYRESVRKAAVDAGRDADKLLRGL